MIKGLIALSMLLTTGFTFYSFGFIGSDGTESQSASHNGSQTIEIQLPEQSTIVGPCVEEMGVQYAVPSSLPAGPIYFVWENQVVGVKYSIDKQEIKDDQAQFNLFRSSFDHLEIVESNTIVEEGTYDILMYSIDEEKKLQIRC